MLSLNNVSKNFKRREVLKGITLDLDNRIYGLLGSNGAGKTTLLRCLLGLYKLNGGEISFNSHNIKNSDLLNKSVGYLPQKFGLFKELTVYDMLSYFASVKNIKKSDYNQCIEECLEKVNLSDRMHDRIGKLSGGMVRRLGIAQAIMGNPDVLIFDEPTQGLDPEERMRFKFLIAKTPKNKTVIISTHIVEDIEATCNNIIIMDKGNILANKNCEEVRSFARGKVYEIAAENENKLDDNCYIEKAIVKEGKSYLRVLSSIAQDGNLVSETVEDGFIAKIKNI